MTVNRRQWEYPVIWLNGANEFWVVEDDISFHRGDARRVRLAGETELVFVDRELRSWKVEGMRLVGSAPRFSDWPRFLFRRPGIVALEAEFQKQLSFEELCSILRACIEKDSECTEDEIASRLERLSDVGNVDELVHAIRAGEI